MKIKHAIGAFALATPFLMSCASTTEKEDPKEKPNILFLFADDLSYNAVNYLGNDIVQTPNINRLAESGTSFTNCFHQGSWSGAVCVASRAMIATGRYIYHARDEINDAPLWGQSFSAAGYDTYITGKWHNKDRTVIKSFDYGVAIGHGMYETKGGKGGMGYFRPSPENNEWSPSDIDLLGHWSPSNKDIVWVDGEKTVTEEYVTQKHTSELYADNAIEFLTNHVPDSDKPFMMYVSFNAPHDPRQSPKEYVDMYPLENIPLPVNYMDLHPFDQGERYSLRDEQLSPFPRTEFAIKTAIQEYYAIITHMDYEIGRIMAALEESGELENTIIVFSGDHGLGMGSHGLLGKQNQYEPSIRMPFVIAGPGIEKGATNDAMMYLQGLYATTGDLADVPVPENLEFKSIAPLLSGEKDEIYDAIFGSYKDFQRMVRTENYKLILYPQVNEVQLFDMKNDPDELNNIAANPENKELKLELYNRLLELQLEVGDDFDLSAMKELL